MKKLIFGFIGLILISNTSYSQDKCDLLVVNGKEYKWEAIDPTKVASLHNVYIEEAVKLSLLDVEQNDKDVLLKIGIPNVTNEYLSCLIDKISTTSDSEMDNIINTNLSNQTSRNLYSKILEALSGDKSVNDISDDLSSIRNEIKNLSNQKDKDILLTCLETGLASATFWLSEEKGGNGLGYKYTHTPGVNKSNGDTRFKKDMRGAGYGMVCWSFSAFLGPVGAAGLAYGAISGALVSSFLP